MNHYMYSIEAYIYTCVCVHRPLLLCKQADVSVALELLYFSPYYCSYAMEVMYLCDYITCTLLVFCRCDGSRLTRTMT